MTMLLGLDVGTSRIKALLYDAQAGRVVATGERPTPVAHPRPEWTDFPADEVWQAVVGAVRDLASSHAAVAQVAAVAVSSLGEAGVPLDGAGRPLAPFIAWFDPRTQPQAERWDRLVAPERIYRITGQRMEYTLGANKWLWWREAEPARAATARHWLSMADWILYRLSGEMATDYTLAARTGLFDQRARAWSAELLSVAEMPAALLPTAVPSATAIGRVHASAAQATGLPEGAWVVTGGHDHLCAALAGGAIAPGTALDSTGTATSVVVPVARYLGDTIPWQSGLACYAHTAPGLYVVRAGLKSAGGAVAWLVRTLWGSEPGEEAWATLLAEAAQAEGSRSGLFWMPAFLGTGTPDGDYGAHAALVGLTPQHTRGDILRALLEALAFWLRRNLDALEELTGQRLATVRLMGGSTRLELLTQLKATISGRPIHVPEIVEGSALGAALLAGIGCGAFHSAEEAFASLRLRERTYPPDPAAGQLYGRLYQEVYLALYPALAALEGRLAQARPPR